MKEFFGITEKQYKFEMMDVNTLLTVINVTLVLMGIPWAPYVGIMNCGLSIIIAARGITHINFYIIQFALVVLNCYFLTLQLTIKIKVV